MEDRKDILYVFATICLFGILGLYLALSQGDSVGGVINIPFRNVRVTTEPDVTASPTSIIGDTLVPAQSGDYYAIFKTNFGDIEIDLDEKNAPNSVKSFIFLAESRYYDGTHFHRFIPGLFIQGGSRNTLNDDPSDDKYGNPGYVIDDEINWDSLSLSEEKKQQLSNDGYSSKESIESIKMESYVIAWANSSPNTNGSQFFITFQNADSDRLSSLEGRHTVFGRVTSGQDVVNKISQINVNLENIDEPRPSETVRILSISIENR